MIRILELNADKKEVKVLSIEQYQPSKNLTWIDLYRPSQKELEAVSKKTGIAAGEIKESVSLTKRPQVSQHEHHGYIICRGVFEDENGIRTAPIGMFVTSKDVLTIHNKPIAGMALLRSLPPSHLVMIFKRGTTQLAYRIMDAIISDFFTLMDKVEDSIDIIEHHVLYDPSKTTTNNIFVEKRKLIYSHKALLANRDVVAAIEKGYLKDLKVEDLWMFRNLNNDIAQLLDLTSTYRDVLTSVMDMHLSATNNNLNKVVKTLTALSAFVMIPTLISSIYGMNFSTAHPFNMPELTWAYGYPFAIGLMIFSVVIVYIWFKKKGWL